MTQENKNLLLKDLCARVPYHPKGHIVNVFTGANYDEYLTCATFKDFANVMNNCQLYLRPMSSMTEEEWKEYRDITCCLIEECEGWNEVDWLNAHHFDYRGLIDKGLAIEVTKENNPYKQ